MNNLTSVHLSFRFSTPQTIADDLENLHSDLHAEESHQKVMNNGSQFNDNYLIEDNKNDDLEQRFTISNEEFANFQDFGQDFFNESQRINDRDFEFFSNVSDYDLTNDFNERVNNALTNDIIQSIKSPLKNKTVNNVTSQVFKGTNVTTNDFNVFNKSFNGFEDYSEIELKNATSFLDNKMEIMDWNWLQLPNLFVLILIVHFVLCMFLLLFILVICLKTKLRKSRRKSRKFARSLSRRFGSNVYWMSERGGAVTSSSFRSSPLWQRTANQEESFYKREEETPASLQQHVAVIQPKLRISRPLAPRPFGLDIELDIGDNERAKSTEVATPSLTSFGHANDSDNGVYASPYADFVRKESVLYEAPLQERVQLSSISNDDKIDATNACNEDESENASNDRSPSTPDSGKRCGRVPSENEVGADVIN